MTKEYEGFKYDKNSTVYKMLKLGKLDPQSLELLSLCLGVERVMKSNVQD